MAYSVRQLKQILRHHALKDEALLKLVGRRVFTAHDKNSAEATRAEPTAIFEFRGGNEYESAPVARRELFVYGYSNVSQDQADEVYEAIANLIRRGAGLTAPPDENGDPCFDSCAYFIPANVVRTGENPEVSAYFCRGTWFAWQVG